MKKIFLISLLLSNFLVSVFSYAIEVKKYPIPYNEDNEKLIFQASLEHDIIDIWKQENLQQIIFNLEDYQFYERGKDGIRIVSNNLSLLNDYGDWFLYDYKTKQKIKQIYPNLGDGVYLSGAKLINDDIYYFGSSFSNNKGDVKMYPFVKKNNEVVYENYKETSTILNIDEKLDFYTGMKITSNKTYPVYWHKGKQQNINLRAKQAGGLWINNDLIIGYYEKRNDRYGYFFYDTSLKKIKIMPIEQKCSYKEATEYDNDSHIIFSSCLGNSYFLHEDLGYIFWKDLSERFFDNKEASSNVLGVSKDGKALIGYTQEYVWEMELEKPLLDYLIEFKEKTN